MKKIFSVIVSLMMVLAMMCPAFAAEDTFVPSISEKEGPSLVVDDEGDVGEVIDEDGNVVGTVENECLVVTSIANVDESDKIPDAAAALLREVYQKLLSGEMVIPAEKLGANLENDEIVIRELVDISWLCVEHPEIVAPTGVVFQVTLDLGIGADETVYVMTYKNNEWNPIVSVVNNGDGTVTCTFEHLCPVAFIMAEDKDVPITSGALDMEVFFWMIVMGVAAAAMVAVFALRGKGRAA